jgi:hypothetical protein
MKVSEQVELVLLGAVDSRFQEPSNFCKAWDREDKETQKKWQEAIHKEFKDVLRKEVWWYVQKATIDKNSRLIECKWVFKVNKIGVHHARLVALGYNQVSDVDFADNFAPMLNDYTFRMILVIYLTQKLDSEIINVDAAFLYGDLEEKICMKILEGLKESMI